MNQNAKIVGRRLCSLSLKDVALLEVAHLLILHTFVCNFCLSTQDKYLQTIIIKFPYNARSDWLEQRALSENKARIDGKLAFKFLLRNFDKFDTN